MALVLKEKKNGLDESKMILTIKGYDSYPVIERFILDKIMVFRNGGKYRFCNDLFFYYNAIDDKIENYIQQYKTVAQVVFNLNLLRKEDVVNALSDISKKIAVNNNRDNSSGIYTDSIRVVADYINGRLKKKFTDSIKEYQKNVMKGELPYNSCFLIDDFPIDAVFRKYAYSYSFDDEPDHLKKIVWDYIAQSKGSLNADMDTSRISSYGFNRLYDGIIGSNLGDKETMINRYLEEYDTNFYSNLISLGMRRDVDMSFLDNRHKLNIFTMIYKQDDYIFTMNYKQDDYIQSASTFLNSIKPEDTLFIKYKDSHMFSDIFQWDDGLHDILVYEVSDYTWDDIAIFFLNKHRHMESTIMALERYENYNQNRVKFGSKLVSAIKSHADSFKQYMSSLGQVSIVDELVDLIESNEYHTSPNHKNIDEL